MERFGPHFNAYWWTVLGGYLGLHTIPGTPVSNWADDDDGGGDAGC